MGMNSTNCLAFYFENVLGINEDKSYKILNVVNVNNDDILFLAKLFCPEITKISK